MQLVKNIEFLYIRVLKIMNFSGTYHKVSVSETFACFLLLQRGHNFQLPVRAVGLLFPDQWVRLY